MPSNMSPDQERVDDAHRQRCDSAERVPNLGLLLTNRPRRKRIAIRTTLLDSRKKHALTWAFASFPHPCGGNRIADATVPFPPYVGLHAAGGAGAADPVHRPVSLDSGHHVRPHISRSPHLWTELWKTGGPYSYAETIVVGNRIVGPGYRTIAIPAQ